MEFFDFVRYGSKKNYNLGVVTHMAGIGRGYYTEAEIHQLTDWICEQFSVAREPSDRVHFSPYHPIAAIGQYLKCELIAALKRGLQ